MADGHEKGKQTKGGGASPKLNPDRTLEIREVDPVPGRQNY